MQHKLSLFALFVLFLAVLTLVACGSVFAPPSSPNVGFLPMATRPAIVIIQGDQAVCVECAQATLDMALTQAQAGSDNSAAATAEFSRALAQATIKSAMATLGAAQTQEKSNANVVAAEIAATVEIMRANAEATLVAAGSTQNAATTQDAIRQTQVQNLLQVTADQATQQARATVTQQRYDLLANSTQTAVANKIATQTQSAVATTQWYTDQARQRNEQRQGPLTFLWLWCPPLFIVSIVLIILLFFYRWMRIRETQQLMDMQAAAPPIILDHQPRPLIPPSTNPPSNNPPSEIQPTDNVDKWMDEVKRKITDDEKDDNDSPGS